MAFALCLVLFPGQAEILHRQRKGKRKKEPKTAVSLTYIFTNKKELLRCEAALLQFMKTSEFPIRTQHPVFRVRIQIKFYIYPVYM